jgi:hypothetical protein
MALVGSEPGTNDAGGIVVNPNAAGTKYEGPLTIYYVPDPDKPLHSFMHIFLRLRKGSTLWGFSGISSESVIPTVTTDGQAQVTAFMNETVMPILYPGYSPPSDPNDMQTSNYPWYLKSVDQVVTDQAPLPGELPCCNNMTFVIMDVIVAVQD